MKKRWWILIIALGIISLIIIFIFLNLKLISKKLCDLRPEAESICMMGCETTHPRANCYYGVAIVTNDYTFCEGNWSMDGFSKDQCYLNFQIFTSNPEVCKKISNENTNLKGECYSNSAVNKKDLNYCELIINDSGRGSKDDCYENYAWRYKDTNICEKVKLINGYHPSRDCCYNDIAMDLLNSSICDKINLETARYNKTLAQDCSKEKCQNGISRKNELKACEKVKDELEINKCYNNISKKYENIPWAF